MAYVDVFVAAVPTANKAAYQEKCVEIQRVFKMCGATEVLDAWGADVPEGEVTSFLKAVACKPDETVAVGWVVWPSKEAREEGSAKVWQDPVFSDPDMDMPFDGKRMIFGGFSVFSQI
ncbi:DUF1428 domain-containing protein [Pseudovibrio sp. SPO723]|uniref:DUF1428 domain-containing protein n=1 Tax=Nesiotobacter zosterae TaxID=392721 RepID=UPI0029C1A391|nr:DUF1428 domain-containing protein [Pseudovibrio sp. SPO723]MDX5593275.1 DUF1428 domain-containing protein [Pseudovibrio sp. SPO723]